MGHRQDCQYTWLGSEGYVGTMVDRWSAWLTDQGFTGQINDQEFAWLGSLGYTGQLNDRWFAYLRDQGATGALPDMMKQFWCGEGGVGPGPVLFLLDARFDSYPGIFDQAPTNGQVLGPQQGVQVGALALYVPTSTGGIANGVLTLGKVAGGGAGLADPVTLPGDRGNFIKTDFSSTTPASEIAGFYLSATMEANQSRTTLQRLSTGAIRWFVDNVAQADLPISIAGAWSALIIADTDGSHGYVKALSDGIWIYVGTVTSAAPAYFAGTQAITNDSDHVYENVEIGTDASAILDARGPDLCNPVDGQWAVDAAGGGATVIAGDEITVDGSQSGAFNIRNDQNGENLSDGVYYEWTLSILESTGSAGNIGLRINNSDPAGVYQSVAGEHSHIAVRSGTSPAPFQIRVQDSFTGRISISGHTIKEVTAPSAAIDNLKGDIVSASFGPAETATNVLTLNNGDELHDDYPNTGAGKIRKGALVYTGAGHDTTVAGGVAAPNTGNSLSIAFTESENMMVEAGLSVCSRVLNSPSANAAMLAYCAWANGVNAATNPGNVKYRLGRLNAQGLEAAVYDAAGTPLEMVTIEAAHTGDHDYQITLGGYDVNGSPVPEGVYGAIFLLDGALAYSTAKEAYAALRATTNWNAIPFTLDSLQTKIDKSVLKTPQRSLFADTFLTRDEDMGAAYDSSTSEWVDEGGGVFSIDGSQVTEFAEIAFPHQELVLNDQVRVVCTILTAEAGSIAVRVGTAVVATWTAPGTYESLMTVAVASVFQTTLRADVDFVGSVKVDTLAVYKASRDIGNYVPEDGPAFRTYLGDVTVQGGGAYSTANEYALTVVPSLDPQFCEGEFVVEEDGSYVGLAFRVVDPANYWVWAFFTSTGTPVYTLSEVVDGAITGRANGVAAFTVGVPFRAILTDDGANMMGWHSGGSAVTHSSTSHNAGSAKGLWFFPSASVVLPTKCNWFCTRG